MTKLPLILQHIVGESGWPSLRTSLRNWARMAGKMSLQRMPSSSGGRRSSRMLGAADTIPKGKPSTAFLNQSSHVQENISMPSSVHLSCVGPELCTLQLMRSASVRVECQCAHDIAIAISTSPGESISSSQACLFARLLSTTLATLTAMAANGRSCTGRCLVLCQGRFVRQAGDMPLEEWLAKEKDGTIPSGDYIVTAILDERRRPRGCIDEFIVKWKASICLVDTLTS